MKILSWSAGAIAAFSLTQCAPESGLSPVADIAAGAVTSIGPVTSAVQDPSGSRLEYTDSKGNQYVYNLYQVTGYTLAKVSPGGRVLNENTGRWSYQKTGEKTGRLTFDVFLPDPREELQDYVIAHELCTSTRRTMGSCGSVIGHSLK